MHQQLLQRIIDKVFDHGRCSAVFAGLGDKVVAIAAAAGQRNKQAAPGNLAGINADAVEMGIHPVEGGGQRLEQIGQTQRIKHERPPNAAARGWPVQYR